MSATKEYFEQFFQEEHNDFVTDDSYQDYLRMQREHEQAAELEKIHDEPDEEILIQRGPKMIFDWNKQANDFLNKSEITNDLPF